jgi:DNA-binding LacI/PurR family transcriptional regulator
VQEDIDDLCRFLDRPNGPTAVVSLQPATTLELFEALQRMNWRIPEDLSLVVLDSVPIITDRVRLPLTRVDLQQRAIAAEALNRLMDRIEGRRTVQEQIIIPAQLDVQKSAIPLTERERPLHTTGYTRQFPHNQAHSNEEAP